MKKSAVFVLLLLIALFTVQAQVLFPPVDTSPVINSRSAVIMDAVTGTVLFVKNPDDEIPPASLTKLMTMHLVMKEAQRNPSCLDEVFSPPKESWAINQPPRSSLMFLAAGQQTTLRELLLGLAVSSGNDAAVAAALCLAPSVEIFADMMNREAENLGLRKTHFVEPSGISEYNMTSARDFTQFCRFYIQAHPEAMETYHSVREFAYPKPENVAEVFRAKPGTIVQYNSNKLLGTVEGVDGLKTGYIDEAGYNIALSAKRNETRFIAVILGAPLRGGEQIRNEDGKRLLNWAFDHYKTVLPPAPELEKNRVWKGKVNYIDLEPNAPLEFTAHIDRAQPLFYRTEIIDPLIAPLEAGTSAGDLIFYDAEGELYRVPLVCSGQVEDGGFFKRLFDSIQLFFRK